MSLEKEKETYWNKLPELLKDAGKFVLIHGDRVVQTFESYADAISCDYEEFGPDTDFLVKRIEATETVQTISRFLDPTPA